MIAVLQRVRSASVEVSGRLIGSIDQGLLMFVCAEPSDSLLQAEKLIRKVLKLRIFSDEAGKMNRSLQDVGGGLLIVSQFTLAADVSSGNRPGFTAAAPAGLGRILYQHCLDCARSLHDGKVACGEFGADMQVRLVNDGPVTIPLHIN